MYLWRHDMEILDSLAAVRPKERTWTTRFGTSQIKATKNVFSRVVFSQERAINLVSTISLAEPQLICLASMLYRSKWHFAVAISSRISRHFQSTVVSPLIYISRVAWNIKDMPQIFSNPICIAQLLWWHVAIVWGVHCGRIKF